MSGFAETEADLFNLVAFIYVPFSQWRTSCYRRRNRIGNATHPIDQIVRYKPLRASCGILTHCW